MYSKDILKEPFNIEVHKKVFINYLEIIVLEDGTIIYATPSHQEKLIQLGCEALGVNREELMDLCPPEYYFDFMTWLCRTSNSVAVWNKFTVGKINDKQREALTMLKNEGLYMGEIK